MIPGFDDRPAWQHQAACRGMDPDLFFPAGGGVTPEAAAACSGCPVRAECLAEGVAQGERYGTRGGRSFDTRRWPVKAGR